MKINREVFKKIVDDYYSTAPPFKFTLALDFDNCICASSYPECGDETPVCNFIRSIQDLDIIIILNACREGYNLKSALDWCKEHCIRIDYANENDPDRIRVFGDCRKIACTVSIDDTNLMFSTLDFD